MKILTKLTLFILIITLLVGTFSGCQNVGGNPTEPTVKFTEYDLVKDGRTEYKVVSPLGSDEYMNATLMEFLYFFKLATNIEMPNITEDQATYTNDEKLIVLGDCEKLLEDANLTVNFSELGESGFEIKTVGQSVFISGGFRYGTVNGVYEFMRKTFNYEIYAQDEIVIDKEVKDKKLPDLSIKKIPDIQVLSPGCGLPINDRTYGMRLGYHGYDQLEIPVIDSEGKSHNGHHDRFIVPFDVYGEEHPDWFGAANSRHGKQLCYTNEEMYEQAYLPKVKEFVAMYPDRYWFAISQSDNTPLCKCERCSSETAKYGSYSGIFVKFSNKLANDLNSWLASEGSDRVIKVLCHAYQETMDPPVKYNQATGEYTAIDQSVIPNENVYVAMALSSQLPPISIYDEKNGGCYSQIKGWAAIAPAFTCWSYGQTFLDYFVPTNLYNAMADMFKYMKEVSCIKLNVQMQVDNLNGTDFYHLKTWLQSKLRWDVNADIDALIEEYFTHYFGAASTEMLTFFNELRAWFNYIENYLGYGIGQQVGGNSDRKFWPKGLLDNFMKHFENAKKTLEPIKNTDPERYVQLVDRIELESLSYRYIIANNYEAYYTESEFTAIRRQIKNDILRFNIKKLKDGATGTSDLVYNGWNV